MIGACYRCHRHRPPSALPPCDQRLSGCSRWVALPILVVFSVGMVTDDEIEASQRLVMAPLFILGAWASS